MLDAPIGDEGEGSGGQAKKGDSTPAALVESYKQFTSFHATQETLFWTRNNLLVLMQVGLIAALFALLGRKQPDPWHLIPVGTLGISLVGLGLTRAWIQWSNAAGTCSTWRYPFWQNLVGHT